jgi:catechol 2,3-dioxygenase-like lactoylglutathione lyase family enzyme
MWVTKERTDMLDHIILTVGDVERSLKFYTAALKPLKIKMFVPYKGADGHPDLWGFGDGQKAFFWLKQGQPDPASIHWGFIADNNKAVDAFYKAAIAAGGKDNISPRARLEYIIPAITPRACLIQMATRLKSFTRASFGECSS